MKAIDPLAHTLVLSRRKLFTQSAQCFAVMPIFQALSALEAADDKPEIGNQDSLRDIVVILSRNPHIVKLGRALYAQRSPIEPNLRALSQQYREHLGRIQEGHTSVCSRLSSLVEEDFRNNRVVLLEGWVISHAESYLCQLATFHASHLHPI